MHVDRISLLIIPTQSWPEISLDQHSRICNIEITLCFGSLKKQMISCPFAISLLCGLGQLGFLQGSLFKHDVRKGMPEGQGVANGTRLSGLWEGWIFGHHLWTSWLDRLGQAA